MHWEQHEIARTDPVSHEVSGSRGLVVESPNRIEDSNTSLHTHESGMSKRTGFLKPRNDPMKVSGNDMPNHRHSRASRVVKGMAADDLAPHKRRLRKKNTPNNTLCKKEGII